MFTELRGFENRWFRLALEGLIMVSGDCDCIGQHSVYTLRFKFTDLLVSAAIFGETSKSSVCFLSKA
jgi:hypothetical protein